MSKNQVADWDIGLLEKYLQLLDTEISETHSAIRSSRDPETDGLCDTGEYFIGQGFVAMQRYQTSVLGQFWIDKGFDFDQRSEKDRLLDMPPFCSGGEAIARIIHAAANYWKHSEEWWRIGQDLKSESEVKSSKRLSLAETTLARLETVAPLGLYYCSDILAALTETNEPMLTEVVPMIAAWRDELIDHYDRLNAQRPI